LGLPVFFVVIFAGAKEGRFVAVGLIVGILVVGILVGTREGRAEGLKVGEEITFRVVRFDIGSTVGV
jgi:hypothetical protein